MIVIISNKKRIRSYICFVLAGFLATVSFAGLERAERKSVITNAENKPAYLAIIIDDFGNNADGTSQMISLPIEFTGAVMPSMENTQNECQLLNENGKGVILHMPMQAHSGKPNWLGNTPILNDYSQEKAAEVFKDCLGQIVYASGVNNHMGSKVMENEELLEAMMNEIKDKDLIFVDSMTTGKTAGEKTAEKFGIKYYKRDVFLDSTDDISKIQNNILKASEVAKKKGYAVAIGHVGQEGGMKTYQAIKNLYERLEAEGIEFVTIKNLDKKLNESKNIKPL